MIPRASAPPTDAEGRLRQEARLLYRQLFSTEPTAEVVAQYCQAHASIKLTEQRELMQTVRTVVDLGLDAEAVELALRGRHPRHPLRQKMLILTYLAEAETRNYPLFVNTRASLLLALMRLAGHLLRSVGKLVKGRLLIWRHTLA